MSACAFAGHETTLLCRGASHGRHVCSIGTSRGSGTGAGRLWPQVAEPSFGNACAPAHAAAAPTFGKSCARLGWANGSAHGPTLARALAGQHDEIGPHGAHLSVGAVIGHDERG